jgi:hypothetical protein
MRKIDRDTDNNQSSDPYLFQIGELVEGNGSSPPYLMRWESIEPLIFAFFADDGALFQPLMPIIRLLSVSRSVIRCHPAMSWGERRLNPSESLSLRLNAPQVRQRVYRSEPKLQGYNVLIGASWRCHYAAHYDYREMVFQTCHGLCSMWQKLLVP